jgi:hypothetical protein
MTINHHLCAILNQRHPGNDYRANVKCVTWYPGGIDSGYLPLFTDSLDSCALIVAVLTPDERFALDEALCGWYSAETAASALANATGYREDEDGHQ